MTTGAKKSGSAGRYGARYGGTLRQKVSDVEKRQKLRHECPECHKLSVKRKFKGVWQCLRCDHTFASKAYVIGE